MSRSKKHKKQHWVPRAYLKAWCDPAVPTGQEPYVWRFAKDAQTVGRKAPQNIFYETDLYTIHLADGARDLTVEHGLSGLEDRFVGIRDNVLAKRQPIPPDDDLLLRAFLAAMQSRTPAHLEHWQGQYKSLLDQMDEMRQAMAAKTPEERERTAAMMGPTTTGPSASYEDVKAVAEGPVGPMLVTMIESQLPILAQMNLAVLNTTDSLGFITSDQPCVWFDPQAYKRPPLYQAPGLAFPTIEVTLPVSPSQIILLSWHELTGYVDVPVKVVDDTNRRTRFSCHEHFVARHNQTRPIWFDPGRPPE